MVFGCEESGLNDLDLDRCTHLVELPASRDYPSFNLAQAVLLAAWELRRADPWPAPRAEAAPPAPHEDREQMYRHLEEALLEIGFLHDESVEPIMRRMRRLVGRATDAPEVIERRLKKAEDEYRERVKYDHVVVNDDLERAVAEVTGLAGLGQASEPAG